MIIQDIKRNVSYYIIAHVSKFVGPGVIRIGFENLSSLPNEASKNPESSKKLIVLNSRSGLQNFSIGFHKLQQMRVLVLIE